MGVLTNIYFKDLFFLLSSLSGLLFFTRGDSQARGWGVRANLNFFCQGGRCKTNLNKKVGGARQIIFFLSFCLFFCPFGIHFFLMGGGGKARRGWLPLQQRHSHRRLRQYTFLVIY